MQFAQEHNVHLPYKSQQELEQAFNFTSLQSFLDVYYECTDTIRNPEQIYRIGCDYLVKAQQQGVVHTELTTEPQAYFQRGIAFEQMMEALTAVKQTGASMGISVGIILGLIRHLPPEQATYYVEKSKPFRDHIVGIGLASTEVGNPPSLFAPAFALAKELGYHRTCHAGEEAGPDYIWQALQIGAERIDHGVHCMQDKQLVSYLAQHQIPITVCPISNVDLQVTPSLEQHPLRQMMQAELNVSINSDDPGFFSSYIGDNYIAVAKSGLLNDEQLIQCAINSAKGAFLPHQEKERIIEQITTFFKKISPKG